MVSNYNLDCVPTLKNDFEEDDIPDHHVIRRRSCFLPYYFEYTSWGKLLNGREI